MSERRWHQLHWATWVAVLVVAATLCRVQFEDRGEAMGFQLMGGNETVWTYHGWPRAFRKHSIENDHNTGVVLMEWNDWSVRDAFADGIVWLALLISTGIIVQALSTGRRFSLATLLTLPVAVGFLLAFDPITHLIQAGQFGNDIP